MKTKQFRELGIPSDTIQQARAAVIAASRAGLKKKAIEAVVRDVAADPTRFTNDPHFGAVARALLNRNTRRERRDFAWRESPAPWRQWGEDLDEQSVKQMRSACELPVAVQGALMPDAHVGYGLPIGGVLATKNAVVPYAVGVDIACRVKLTVLDMPVDSLSRREDELINALVRETKFGVGSKFTKPRQHEVMDKNWNVSPVTRRNKDKAWSQLGTSGSGNHFVEYGRFIVDTDDLGIPAGEFLALLSHSGSRGTGASVCQHYSKLAQQQHRNLPNELRHLAWLDLDSEEGAEYWAAMNLMGEYASANHACIHRHIHKALGTEPILDIENHHNFAWKETHNGEDLIIHRKGATPAGEGVLGIIPGSMASPCYVVRGRGDPDSLDSAAHGAGRVMSRKQAKRTLRWADAKDVLAQRGVKLLSAGLDEVPMVYKNIDEVMAAQSDLVDTLARFEPKIVKMAPAGERPED